MTQQQNSLSLRKVQGQGKGRNLHDSVKNTVQRPMAGVPEPFSHLPTDKEFWLPGSLLKLPNIPYIQNHLINEGKFEARHLERLFELAFDALSVEPNVVQVSCPVTVCGDIHGQFYDLIKLITVGGDPSTRNYLFLGDYVDRGDFSIETVILLFCFKITYPLTFFLLRGNHESRMLTQHFSFKDEVFTKYSERLYDGLMDVFDALPLAAILNGQFFCVHAGISPEIESLDDLNAINRFTEPPNSGLFCDLLWSDPCEEFNDDDSFEFMRNRSRGCSYNYGFAAVKDFLQKTSLLSVIRAHECQQHGYRMFKKGGSAQFPVVMTLFSAPNYMCHYQNKAAIMCCDGSALTIKQFNSSPSPFVLPDFQNALAWSLPFVADRLREFVDALMVLVKEEDDKDEEEEMTNKLIQSDSTNSSEEERVEMELIQQVSGNNAQNNTKMRLLYQHMKEDIPKPDQELLLKVESKPRIKPKTPPTTPKPEIVPEPITQPHHEEKLGFKKFQTLIEAFPNDPLPVTKGKIFRRKPGALFSVSDGSILQGKSTFKNSPKKQNSGTLTSKTKEEKSTTTTETKAVPSIIFQRTI